MIICSDHNQWNPVPGMLIIWANGYEVGNKTPQLSGGLKTWPPFGESRGQFEEAGEWSGTWSLMNPNEVTLKNLILIFWNILLRNVAPSPTAQMSKWVLLKEVMHFGQWEVPGKQVAIRILTPQKWLFWGPQNTPAKNRFIHPSIGGCNRGFLGCCEFTSTLGLVREFERVPTQLRLRNYRKNIAQEGWWNGCGSER